MTFGRAGQTATALAFALATTGLGGWTAYKESQPYFAEGSTSISRLAALPGNANAPGLSSLTWRETLSDCATALSTMQSLEMRFQPQPAQDAMAPHCLAIADNVAANTPTDSFAWYIGALATSRLQDWQGFNQRLQRSQLTGKTEQWVAELRVDLVETNYDRLEPGLLPGHEQDLRLLVTSGRGVASIAKRYVAEPAFRDRIAAIVETTPDSDQGRFITLLRREMK